MRVSGIAAFTLLEPLALMRWSRPADLVREAIKMAGNFPTAWVDQGLSTSPDAEMRIPHCAVHVNQIPILRIEKRRIIVKQR